MAYKIKINDNILLSIYYYIIGGEKNVDFLDFRSSQQGATGNLASGNGTFLGDIGLIVGNAANIRVGLSATIGINAAGEPPVLTFYILRNIPAAQITTTFNSSNIIYTNTQEVSLSGAPLFFTIAAADFNPSSSNTEPGQINYSLWVASSTPNVALSGPQTFWGIATAQ